MDEIRISTPFSILNRQYSWSRFAFGILALLMQAPTNANIQPAFLETCLPAEGPLRLKNNNPTPQGLDGDVSALPVAYHYAILARYSHDRNAFTEGLAFYRGRLFESTGQWGQSSLRELAPERGTVIRRIELSRYHFGEGLTEFNGRLLQLTWKAGEALLYDPDTLAETDRFYFQGEGWGATVVDHQLVISDGSAQLKFLDPVSLTVTDRLTVKQGSVAISGLNELEFAEGRLFANIWPGNCVAEIDPKNGQVLGWLDLTGLVPKSAKLAESSVLNGIAYDTEAKNWLITGKNWPYFYRISIQRNPTP